MRVVLLSEMYSPDMGYLENMFPKYLARLGVDVHVIATDLPTSYRLKSLSGSPMVLPGGLPAGTVQNLAGYMLHILGHKKVAGHMRMVGLLKKLRTIRPDIVQTIVPIGWIPLEAALFKPLLGYKLFTGSHMTASVFPLATRKTHWWQWERLRCTLTRTPPGRFASLFTEKCYGATVDCGEIATRFFGVSPKKIAVCPLGIDTELFNPSNGKQGSQERLALRHRLGFADSEIVYVYSGRLAADKNPLLLAKAVAQLVARGEPFRGLFVGNGVQEEAIRSQSGCVTHSFVPVHELASFFRAAEIGVWPTQESMSMLDATACGLPIVVNDTLQAKERIAGNGITYRLNDQEDLVRALLSLRDANVRKSLGSVGAARMASEFSWEAVVRQRLHDYEAALGRGR